MEKPIWPGWHQGMLKWGSYRAPRLLEETTAVDPSPKQNLLALPHPPSDIHCPVAPGKGLQGVVCLGCGEAQKWTGEGQAGTCGRHTGMGEGKEGMDGDLVLSRRRALGTLGLGSLKTWNQTCCWIRISTLLHFDVSRNVWERLGMYVHALLFFFSTSSKTNTASILQGKRERRKTSSNWDYKMGLQKFASISRHDLWMSYNNCNV